VIRTGILTYSKTELEAILNAKIIIQMDRTNSIYSEFMNKDAIYTEFLPSKSSAYDFIRNTLGIKSLNIQSTPDIIVEDLLAIFASRLSKKDCSPTKQPRVLVDMLTHGANLFRMHLYKDTIV